MYGGKDKISTEKKIYSHAVLKKILETFPRFRGERQ